MGERPKVSLAQWTGGQDAVGLVCTKCGCRHFRVLHTRPASGGVIRERACRNCGQKRTTFEK